MNFPVSSIFVIILLLPGVIALKAYYGHFKVKKANIHIPFTELLLNGIVFSFIIHVCAICILTAWIGRLPSFNALFHIVFSQQSIYTDVEYTRFFKQFGFYNLVIFCATWAVTKLVKRVIELKDINLNFNAFKNSHYWYQIFSAKNLDAKGVTGTQEKTALIFVDVLTESNIIYSGFLYDFNYNPLKDELENIVIKSTHKRHYDRNPEDHQIIQENPTVHQHTTGRPLRIPGDVFVIPYSKIVNLNVYYIKAERKPKQKKN